jgi:6,7-dimethyl-8-ribityllumazine synthase
MNEMKKTSPSTTEARAAGRRFAILATRWYEEIIDGLLAGAREALLASGAAEADLQVFRVPGAFEMPLTAKTAAETGRFAGIVCLGAVIRGETPHFDYIAGETAAGLAAVARETGVPVGFGVLTCDTLEQAQARSEAGEGNKGAEAALAVVEMVDLLERLRDAI